MDCDLTWPSRPFRHRVAQFLFQMQITLFLASIALYRPPTPHLSLKVQTLQSVHRCLPLLHSPCSKCVQCTMYTWEFAVCVKDMWVGGWMQGLAGWIQSLVRMLPCTESRLPCCHVAMYYCTESRFQMPRAFIVPFPFYAVVYQPPVLHKGLTFGSNDRQSFSPLHFLTASNINCTYLKCDFTQGNLLLICEPVLVFYPV